MSRKSAPPEARCQKNRRVRRGIETLPVQDDENFRDRCVMGPSGFQDVSLKSSNLLDWAKTRCRTCSARIGGVCNGKKRVSETVVESPTDRLARQRRYRSGYRISAVKKRSLVHLKGEGEG